MKLSAIVLSAIVASAAATPESSHIRQDLENVASEAGAAPAVNFDIEEVEQDLEKLDRDIRAHEEAKGENSAEEEDGMSRAEKEAADEALLGKLGTAEKQVIADTQKSSAAIYENEKEGVNNAIEQGSRWWSRVKATVAKAVSGNAFAKADKARSDEGLEPIRNGEAEGRHSARIFPPQGSPSVKDVARAGEECNTGRLSTLSEQIMTCAHAAGQEFSCITEQNVVRVGAVGVMPCFTAGAADAIRRATRAKRDYMTIVGGLRTPAAQMMMLIQKESSVCDMGEVDVPEPGASAYNGGLAVDVNSVSYWSRTLGSNGFTKSLTHEDGSAQFRYTRGNAVESRRGLMKGFQKLWNLNVDERFHIDEDGWYGEDTRKALEMAPADGFEKVCERPPTCQIGGWARVKDLMDEGKIDAKTSHFDARGNRNGGDGADAMSNIRAAINGEKARRSTYGNGPGGVSCLDPRIGSFLADLGEAGNVYVNSIAGGSHSRSSTHYDGYSIDVGQFRGRNMRKSNRAAVMDAVAICRSYNAKQIFNENLNCGRTCVSHTSWLHCGMENP